MFDLSQLPVFHYRPAKGWMNDPNGLVCFGGYYHAFYQHAPAHERPGQEPMVWGHARTKDFLHWEELPVAIAPEYSYEKDGCWSGTAIVKDGKLFLFYASVENVTDETHGQYTKQTVSVAYSDDGVTFTKYERNPILSVVPADGREEDFRDPAVMECGGKYYLVMASANPEKTKGRLLLYESDADLFSWKYCGIAGEWDKADYCECPSLVPFKDEILLTASVCFFAGHRFTLSLGKIENGAFVPRVSGSFQRGPDQYAGQLFRDERGRAILFSWIPGWEYSAFAEKSIGCLSLPLEVTEQDGIFRAYPVEEVQHLLRDSDPYVERTATGFVIHREQKEDVVFEGIIRDLKILHDGYLIEVFVNGGEDVFSAILC